MLRVLRIAAFVVLWVFLSLLFVPDKTCMAADQQNFWSPDIEAAGLDEQRFTELYADALIAATGAKVSIPRPLELFVIHKNGMRGTSFLSNAWNSCKDSPGKRQTILRNYLNMDLGMANRSSGDQEDSPTVVPIVRAEDYVLDLVHKTNNAKGVFISESLGADLFCIYAIDLPTGIQLLGDSKLSSMGIARENLKDLSMNNLDRVLQGKVQIENREGIYVIAADGTYESSFICRPKFWDDQSKQLKAEIVMAVPARDVVMFTRKSDRANLKRMQATTSKIFQEGQHSISESLYLWKDGHWQKWSP